MREVWIPYIYLQARESFLTCSSLDYLFQLAVEMKQLNLPWITDIEPVTPRKP